MHDAAPLKEAAVKVPRILVMGVGSCGARAVARLNKLSPVPDAVAVDTDIRLLESISTKQVIHVGASVTRGMSAGGDVELGRQSIEKDSSAIRMQLKQVDLLVLVTGLGGGTGSGAVPVITRIAREAGSLVLVMASTPFAFEGKMAARIADEAVKRIRTHADAVIRIPNEKLVERGETDLPVEEAFARSHRVMLMGITSLWRMLSTNGICGLDFACIHTMLRNCDGFCHFAGVEGSGRDRAAAVADGLLEHPLLNRGKLLSAAQGVVIGFTGGEDLRLSEIQIVMDRIQEKLPEEAWVNFGVVTDSAFEKRLSAFVLAAEQWKEPLVDAANRQLGFFGGKHKVEGQGELPLEAVGKGEFSYVDPTIHNNQDLDVPAYIRRAIKLPR
ncbi:MAG TPA: cell division protein FtsZ [Pontiella sp.]